MHNHIQYGIAQSDNDLLQILELQKNNLPATLTIETASKEGFVTLQHSLELIKRMNSPYPHIIAKSNHEVVGYALVMLKSFSKDIPILFAMFDQLKDATYQNEKVDNKRYFVMGQICIKQKFRGQGIFVGLYEEMKSRMKDHFDFVITEISSDNKRSLRAHEKVGFETIKVFPSGSGADWIITLLNLHH